MVELVAASAIVEAFAVRLIFQRLRGGPIELGRSIAVGLRRRGTVFGIAAILGAPRVAQMVLDRMLARHGGLLLNLPFVVVIIVMALNFCVATPVAIVEQSGVLASLRRSRDLARDNRGEIFGLYFMIGIAVAIAGLPLRLFSFPTDSWTGFLIDAATDLGAASLYCTIPVVLYHELRETKEGIGLEELAAVFE